MSGDCAGCVMWQKTEPLDRRRDTKGWCHRHRTETYASGDCGDYADSALVRTTGAGTFLLSRDRLGHDKLKHLEVF
jgi:hypothetical protein